MSHLKRISFDNYRVFKEKTFFDLKPITFLIGPNSSGKSSLLKGLLLLKSNISNDLQVLDFSGPKHNLGSIEKTLNKQRDSDKICFGFHATVNFESFPFSYNKTPITTKRSVFHILTEFESKSEVEIYVELTYQKNDGSGKLCTLELYNGISDQSFLKLEIGSTQTASHALSINFEIISKNKNLMELFINKVIRNEFKVNKSFKSKTYKIPTTSKSKDSLTPKYFDEPIQVFTKLYDQFINENVNLKVNREIHKYLIGSPIRRVLKDFAALIENTEYIEAVRANTRRLYTNDSQGTSFNELILEYRSREISQIAIDFTNKWLKKFGIADSVSFKNIEGVANTVYLEKDGDEIALADLGYGITQFLPILLKLSMEIPTKNHETDLKIVKKLILLEEPETNLHPKLQSLIADFLLDALRTFEVRFIVETHSEYIIRKMQILTADTTIDKDETVIYYFNEDGVNDIKSEDKIVQINIKENGALNRDFGDGFYDEAARLKFELLKAKNSLNA